MRGLKKIVGIILTILMLIFVFLTRAQEVKEENIIIETKELYQEELYQEADHEIEVHILTDEDLSKLYSYHIEVRRVDDSIVELSQEDAWLLMKLGASESGVCGVEGQYLTMMVILNRIKSDKFPNTISEVIYQRDCNGNAQFAVIDDGRFDKTEPNVDSHLALARIESGEDTSEGALFFEASTNSSNSWHSKHLTFLYEKNGQRYYK